MATGLVFMALLLLHPLSRSVIYFLLPLGSGADDYVAIALLVIAATILFIKGWTSIPDFFKKGK
jgi:hypothetical protein